MRFRYPPMAPKSGCMIPRSLSYTPVNTSRTKHAPVARATARLATGSQTISMPNGTWIFCLSSPTSAAMAAAVSGPVSSW